MKRTYTTPTVKVVIVQMDMHILAGSASVSDVSLYDGTANNGDAYGHEDENEW